MDFTHTAAARAIHSPIARRIQRVSSWRRLVLLCEADVPSMFSMIIVEKKLELFNGTIRIIVSG